MESRQRWTRIEKLTLAAVLATVVAAVLSSPIWWDWLQPSKHLVVFIADKSKMPRTDIAVVGPKGETIFPDSRGMLVVPRSWAGKNLSAYERATWRELETIRLLDLGDEPQQLTISQ